MERCVDVTSPKVIERWRMHDDEKRRRQPARMSTDPTVSTFVTHYLCVKWRELSMKVVWRAGMAMVWWPSCNQLQSESTLGLKRGKERGSSKYLAEIIDALEIRCTISAPSQEILKKVILGDNKCITLFCDWTPPRECSGTLLNSNHLLYFKVECGTTLFLTQSIRSGGLKDRRRWIVTCDYCWQVQKGVMWHKS